MGLSFGASGLSHIPVGGMGLALKGRDAPTLSHPREGLIQGQDALVVDLRLGGGENMVLFSGGQILRYGEAWSGSLHRTVSGHMEKARTKP